MTLSTWVAIPFNAKLLTYLKSYFPGMQVDVVPPSEGMKLFGPEVDVALSLLGISHSDPLTHLSFLESALDGFSEVGNPKRFDHYQSYSIGVSYRFGGGGNFAHGSRNTGCPVLRQ
ncbi:MAG: hypothetical protein EOP50_02930 [Sphingobacteriales bacterium]|nr:MAG: hypothetical protein EOP50_02930 [Sphingobacteriales bacterium]